MNENTDEAVNLLKKKPPDGFEFRFKKYNKERQLQFWSIFKVYSI